MLLSLKKLFSYFYPIIYKKFQSNISGELELSFQNGVLVLDAENANYSYGSLHAIFQKVVKQFEFNQNKKDTLILGFGAGSIAYILQVENSLNLKIDGVELDPVVLDIYKQHFKIESKLINLVNQEAILFLKNCNKRYDYVFVDVFQNLEVPKSVTSLTFINLLKKVTNINGQIAMNTMFTMEDDFVGHWKSVFRNSHCKTMDIDNLILFAKNSD